MSRSESIRDHRGRTVGLVAASDAKSVGQILDAAGKGRTLAITRYGKVRAVVVPVDEYRALTQPETELSALEREFEALVEAMQAPAARDGVESVFAATPRELGVAARAAARPAATRRRTA